MKISSERHRHLIHVVKRNTQTDGIGPFNKHVASILVFLLNNVSGLCEERWIKETHTSILLFHFTMSVAPTMNFHHATRFARSFKCNLAIYSLIV